MFLFVCTALLAALFLGVKLTKDIFPRPLKAWLLKIAISNWIKSQPQKFGNEVKFEARSYADTGIAPDEQEVLVERPIPIINPLLREEYLIYGTDEESRGIFVKLQRLPNNRSQVDILVTLDDDVYHASYQGETTSTLEFSLGNLRIEMVEPFRIWRLWYNGIMTRASKRETEVRLDHVVFNFLWKALESPMDNRKNGNARLLANHFSSNGLFGENLPSLSKILPEGYSQMGTLHGIVNISDRQENSESESTTQNRFELYLYGFRTREVVTSLEETRMLDIFPVSPRKNDTGNDCSGRFEFFGICEDGNGFRLTAYNDKWTDGRMLWASYEVTPVTDVDCTPSQISHNSTSRKLFNIYDSRNTSIVEILPHVKAIEFSNEMQITFLNLTINGKPGNGILICSKDVIKACRDVRSHNHKRKSLLNNLRESPLVDGKVLNDNGFDDCEPRNTCKQFVLEFSDPACLKVPLVGGKGASLARIQTFTDKLTNSEIRTARGFCITTNLFRDLLELERFVDIFSRSSTASSNNSNQISLEEACLTVMKMIKSCGMEEKISKLISKRIERIFGENLNEVRFAVRSSGVLEDGSDLSCAGQNETFLGVPQYLISQKILDCWASLFTIQSVKYRLNHGQPAVSEMGVVIQEMVNASAAGVIFTADPRSGNPFEMIITANYGLGESVVSGICDPDTITLIRHELVQSKDRNEKCGEKLYNSFITVPSSESQWWTDMTIGKKVLGEKKVKIICRTAVNNKSESLQGDSVGESGGESTTKEISMSDKESKQFCLNEETAIKLGHVAAKIELFVGHHKPVDIEWAIDQAGRIFILQCRNLTALDAWTDFEILHELDAAVRTKRDQFTTANSGEVLPKAIHTITQTMNRCLDLAIQKQIYLRKGNKCPFSPYRTNSCPLFQQRLFINMYQTLYATVEGKITTASVCIDQTVFGRQVIDEEIWKTAAERFGIASGFSKIRDMYTQMKIFKNFKSLVEQADKVYHKFKLDYSKVPDRAQDAYRMMSQDLFHIYETAITHLTTTQASSGSQFFLFLFLSEGKNPSEWDSSLFEDASKLLSVFANVESAEMPEDMNQLGDEIIRHGREKKHIIEEFLQVSPTEALEWLKRNDKVSQALDTFFEKHGHRGFAELDLGEPSWKNDPISFLPILRNILKNKLNHCEKENNPNASKTKISFKNDDELLDSLSSNLRPMTRRLIKFILPTCRNAVVCREKSKSIFVRVIDQFKEKYQYLAKLMVEENLLPSESLIKHMTHFEIGQLVNKDALSSTILQKAMKRNKMYPYMEKLEFPEICVGIPKELDTSIPVTVTDTIQATPVSRGIAKGIAKVCLNVEEASENLHPGDILITHGTDIAWSPFFPVLGGVVTELGGLISHGAVVAREYGLPCIVGAINATKIFKTGDHVILDAGKGTLSKTSE